MAASSTTGPRTLRVWARFTTSGAFDYFRGEVWGQGERAGSTERLEVIEFETEAELVDWLDEISGITLISIQNTLGSSEHYQMIRRAAGQVEVVSVAG